MPNETNNVEDFLRFVNFCWCATHSWRFGHGFEAEQVSMSGSAAESIMILPHTDIDILFIDLHRVASPPNVHLSSELTEGKDVFYIQSSLTNNDIHPGYARLIQHVNEALLSSSEMKKPFVEEGLSQTRRGSPALAFIPNDSNSQDILFKDDMELCSIVSKLINATAGWLNEIQNATSFMDMIAHIHTSLNRALAAEFHPHSGELSSPRLASHVIAKSRNCNKNNVFVKFYSQRYREILEMLGCTTPRSRFNYDFVPYIRCPLWPHEAAEWVTRVRTENWPQQSLIDQCVANGCGFVAASHKETSAEFADFEFRFSFSSAERRLLNSWLPTQIFIYTILKEKVFETNKQFDEKSRFLCSYHVKTLMLWFAETKPTEYWSSDKLVSAIKDLLSEIVTCIIEIQLRHYFIPSNNLFDRPCDSHILDSTVRALYSAAENMEKSSFSVYGSFLGANEPKNVVVSRSIMMQSLPLFNRGSAVRNFALMYELNDLFCGLSLLESERCTDLQQKSYSDASLDTISKFLLEATYDHSGSVKISFPFLQNTVVSIKNCRTFLGRYPRRLTPSSWRRCFAANKSLEKIMSANADLSRPNRSENSPHSELRNPVSRTINLLGLLNRFDNYRFSRFLSKTYLAHFHYNVCQSYEAAVEICDEVCWETKDVTSNTWQIPLSAEWSRIFDVDVQSMLGLALLNEAVRTNAISATSSTSEAVMTNFDDFYLPIPTELFLGYIKARCCIAITSQDIISERRLLSANDVVERLSAVRDTFQQIALYYEFILKYKSKEGCKRCKDSLLTYELSSLLLDAIIAKRSDISN